MRCMLRLRLARLQRRSCRHIRWSERVVACLQMDASVHGNVGCSEEREVFGYTTHMDWVFTHSGSNRIYR
jgi:hypothetical protein